MRLVGAGGLPNMRDCEPAGTCSRSAGATQHVASNVSYQVVKAKVIRDDVPALRVGTKPPAHAAVAQISVSAVPGWMN